MRVPATLTFQGAVPAFSLIRPGAPAVAIALDQRGHPALLYIEGRPVGQVSGWPEVVDSAPEGFTKRTVVNVVLDLPCPSSASPGGLSARGPASQEFDRRFGRGATGALAEDE